MYKEKMMSNNLEGFFFRYSPSKRTLKKRGSPRVSEGVVGLLKVLWFKKVFYIESLRVPQEHGLKKKKKNRIF